MLAEFEPGSSLTLRRNPQYWEAASVAFDEIRYDFVPDENSEFTALQGRRTRRDELRCRSNASRSCVRQPDSGLQHRATLATIYFTFNTDRGPLSGQARPA